MDLPRSSSSSSRPLPNPPPHHPTGYPTPPHRADPSDPFLAQSREIALTERDRQEGYDVELLNARPRGNSRRGEKSTAGGGGEYPMYESSGAGKEGGYGAGALAGAGSLREGPPRRRLGGRDGKKWYLRPLALAIILGLLLAVALALGLGVGLSEAHKNRNNKADEDNSANANSTESSSRGTRNATASIFTATGTESTTAGTVIPSSLYTDISSSFYSSTAAPIASSSAFAAATATPATSSDLSTSIDSSGSLSAEATTILASSSVVPSPATGTTRASTGNLPIPANSATTVGTEVVSSITALGGTDRVRMRWRG